MTLSHDRRQLDRRQLDERGPPGRRAGNLLVLADDLPTEALRLAARREAAVALIAARRFGLAVEQLGALLAAQPGDRAVLRLRARCQARVAPGSAAPTTPDTAAPGRPAAGAPRVFVFSGHMVDAPTRPAPRFPASAVPAAAERIAGALDALGAMAGDIAFSQAAAGGDLLFLQAVHDRGLRAQVLLPFAEDEFIARSMLPSADGAAWRERWLALRAQLPWPPRMMADELGACPPGIDAFERCNRWLLASALASATGGHGGSDGDGDGNGDGGAQLIALWNGAGGDGPGGTRHMIDEVRRCRGRVCWIDTRTL